MLAAAELFAERGLDATKMEDVASVTGVPKATLYYYFESKEEILGLLFTEVLDEVSRVIGDAIGGEDDAAHRLAAAVGAHLSVFERYPMASRALQFDLGPVGKQAMAPADRLRGCRTVAPGTWQSRDSRRSSET